VKGGGARMTEDRRQMKENSGREHGAWGKELVAENRGQS